MDAVDIETVVMKLVGPVDPVGDSRIDADRLDNLKALCNLTEALVGRIAYVAAKDERLASVKAAKDKALACLKSIAEDASGVQPTRGGQQ
jgi:hypothetical protein